MLSVLWPRRPRQRERGVWPELAVQAAGLLLAHRPASAPFAHRPASASLAHRPASASLAHRPASAPLAHRPVSAPLAHRPTSAPLAAGLLPGTQSAREHQIQQEGEDRRPNYTLIKFLFFIFFFTLLGLQNVSIFSKTNLLTTLNLPWSTYSAPMLSPSLPRRRNISRKILLEIDSKSFCWLF